MTSPTHHRRQSGHALSRLLCIAGALICGCAAIDWQDPLNLGVSPVHESEAIAGDYRMQYLTQRDPKALNWLLAHRVVNGMTVAAVGEALGERGEDVVDDAALKTGGYYLQTDDGYSWGPDTNGRSVVLFFRDGKLVNFDPDEFR